MRTVQKFCVNALIMSLAAILMRAIAVGFNVFLSNKIGAEALGLFSLVSSVYGFAITFSTSGINLAVTRLVSEEMGRGNQGNISRVMKRAVLYCLSFSIIAAFVLFFFANYIGENILGEARTVISIRSVAISLPFIALSSAFSGYFCAQRRVYKTAVTNVFEQFVKIMLTVYFLASIAPRGIEYACLSVALGGSIAEGISFFTIFISYVFDKKKHIKNTQKTVEKSLSKRLFSISLPLALSAYATSGLVTVQHILIPKGLRKFGFQNDVALAKYGKVHSMALPIVLFPMAFLSAISGLIVPELSYLAAKHDGNYRCEPVLYAVRRGLEIAMIFGIGVGGIFISLSSMLGNCIYSDGEVGVYIRLLGIVVPIMYLDHVTDGMLKGMNQQLYVMRYNIIDAAASVLLVYTLLPVWGIYGYVFVIGITEIINFAMSFSRLITVTGIKIKFKKWIFSPLFSIIAATSAAAIINKIFVIDFENEIVYLIMNILLILSFYVFMLRVTGGVSDDDVKWIRSLGKRES